MNARELSTVMKFLALTLVLVSLGSCAIVQYNLSQPLTTFNYSLEVDKEIGTRRCAEFKRTVRMGHVEPKPLTNIDPRKLSEEEFSEIVLSYAEKLQDYAIKEKKYLDEDMARHQASCQQ